MSKGVASRKAKIENPSTRHSGDDPLTRLDRSTLMAYYQAMYDAVGPRNWWPADTPFEVIVGAILTQNTAWKNVEKAILNLRQEDLLNVEHLSSVSIDHLKTLIRSSGYFNQKARKIKNFLVFLWRVYGGDLGRMAGEDTATVRQQLLSISGIGPETADDILLYAFHKPSFVIDAYTKRILSRHGLASETVSYERLRSALMESLPEDVVLFNEYHALLDYIGHHFCRRVPDCGKCPLKEFLPETSKYRGSLDEAGSKTKAN